MLYECELCRVISSSPKDLCRPLGMGTTPCSYDLATHDRALLQLCAAMRSAVEQSCAACGRVSPEKELLCSPRPLEEPA